MNLRITVVVFVVLAAGLLAPLSALAQEPPGSKTMEKRTVPTPAGVSQELQDFISGKVIPPPMPVPKTRDEWLKVQRTVDAGNAKQAKEFAEKLGASWKAMEVGGVPCFLVTPKKIGQRFKDRWLIHIHGGAFVLNGGEGCVTEAMYIADACEAQVLSIDYRRPPVHPFPAAIDDAVAVWKAVTERQEASETAILGSSAGGNLTLATTLRLKQLGLPLPGALFAGTPVTDLEKIGDTWYTLEGLDPLGSYDGFVRACLEAYVPSKDFSNPLISPARGDLKGFPPTILISGTRDLILSDTVRMHRALRKANVEADLHVYEGQSHGDYIGGILVDVSESRDAQKEIFRFLDKHLK
jgi:acetyl esterase/lipase